MRASLCTLSLLLIAGCERYPATPEDALSQIEQVVASGDGLAAWKLVDPGTKSAVASVLSSERLMRTIVKGKYPPQEAERELLRLADAEQPDAAHFFAAVEARRGTFTALRGKLSTPTSPMTSMRDDAGGMVVSRAGGVPVRLTSAGGGWAWDLRSEWTLERDRAAHGVKTISDNAALYKKDEAQ